MTSLDIFGISGISRLISIGFSFPISAFLNSGSSFSTSIPCTTQFIFVEIFSSAIIEFLKLTYGTLIKKGLVYLSESFTTAYPTGSWVKISFLSDICIIELIS